jgi:uncharacterized protein with GYD domain
MPQYVILLRWTDQGIRNVKDTAKRAEAARRMFEQAGGKLQVWYTMGEYDIVGLAETPSDDVLFRLNLALGAIGNVRTTTLKAWTEADVANLVAQLP